MNPITCGMAADLLPLYLDGCCSADSCAALEAHMDACPACRAQYAQLRRGLTPAAPAAEDPSTDGIARALARKMRRRRRCLRALGAVLGVLLAVLLVFVGKTFMILGQPGGAASAALPAGATDLVAREVSGTAEEVGEHVFATGTARLVVSGGGQPGGAAGRGAAIANGAVAIQPGAMDWIGLLLVCIVLPAVICWAIGLLCRRLGWIREGDLKLD